VTQLRQVHALLSNIKYRIVISDRGKHTSLFKRCITKVIIFVALIHIFCVQSHLWLEYNVEGRSQWKVDHAEHFGTCFMFLESVMKVLTWLIIEIIVYTGRGSGGLSTSMILLHNGSMISHTMKAMLSWHGWS
jgi:hypothetical protein